MLLAESLFQRDVIATETIAVWAPRIFVALVVLCILVFVNLISDLSTGQNERRDRKERDRG